MNSMDKTKYVAITNKMLITQNRRTFSELEEMIEKQLTG